MPIFTGTSGSDVIIATRGVDTITGLGGNDTIFGGTAQADPTDLRDSISGGAGNDSILGNGGNDTIVGGDGADTIIGGVGADLTFGGGGSDQIIFNANDTVSGGGALDRFVIQQLKTVDTLEVLSAQVTDWVRGERFDFSQIDANLLVAGDQAFQFLGTFGGPVPVAAGQMAAWTSGGTTIIQMSDGVTLASITLTNGTFNLTATDFAL